MRLVTSVPDAESHKLAIERAYADLAEIKATARPEPIPEPTIEVEVVETSSEKRRGASLVNCGVCGVDLYRKPSDVAKSKTGVFFCSREHQEQHAVRPKPLTTSGVSCAICSTPLKRKPSEIAGNKLGVFFCSREHQNQWRSAN